jgi:hypothetical protein
MRLFCFSLLLLFLNVGYSIPPKYKNSGWFLDSIETDGVRLASLSNNKKALLKVIKERGKGWKAGLLVPPFLAPDVFELKINFEAIKPDTFWGKKHSTPLQYNDFSPNPFLGWSYNEDAVTWIMEKEIIKASFKTMNGKEISYSFNVSQLEGAMTEILRQQAALR